MRKFLFIALTFLFFEGNAQVTVNPKIRKKSTDDVFITKVEITSKFTVVWLRFDSKSEKDAMKDYFNSHPAEKEKLLNMDPFMRNLILQQMKGNFESTSTISFQPSSFLKTTDGHKFRFLKAEDIPVSPERIEAEAGRKYNFKVYFEKIPPGYEIIDLVESSTDRNQTMTYWNFLGINIINPAKNQDKVVTPPPPVADEIEQLATQDFRLYGKVIDASTNKPISAKIICKNVDFKDSVTTSKSGSYEFVGKGDEFQFLVQASGYQPLDENVNVKAFKNKNEFNQDLYLEPVKEKPKTEETKKEEPAKQVGEAVGNSKSAFKLDKVYFALGEAVILEDSYVQLNNLAEYLKENPKLNIQIEGHTDNQGDSQLNLKLSVDRAFNVRQYLIKHGIVPDRITYVGYGDTRPISKNNSEESHKLNRRVEYKIIEH